MDKDRFIELLTKELSGEITEVEISELVYLRGEENYNEEEEELLRAYWTNNLKNSYDSTALFKIIEDRIANGDSGEDKLAEPIISEVQDGNHSQTEGFNWIHKAASTILLAFCCFIIYHSYFTYKKELLVKETAKGVRSVFTLRDGSEVRLNSDSRLEYPANFSDSTRDVFLTGEAFFDVSKDKKHPFIIHTKDMNIKVLGTTFNVKAYANENLTETTLLTGAITVTLNDLSKKQIKLKPTQKLVVNNRQQNRKMVSLTKAKMGTSMGQLTYYPGQTTIIETSWTENKLTFKNEDFSSLARSMERWYNVEFKFENQQAKQLRFTGIIEKENVDEALKALQLTESFNYSISDSIVRIL